MSDMEKQSLSLDTPSQEVSDPIKPADGDDEELIDFPSTSDRGEKKDVEKEDDKENGSAKRKLEDKEEHEDDGMKQTTLDGVVTSDKQEDKKSKNDEKHLEGKKADAKKSDAEEPKQKKAKVEGSNGHTTEESKTTSEPETSDESKEKKTDSTSDPKSEQTTPSKARTTSAPTQSKDTPTEARTTSASGPAATGAPASEEPTTNPGDSAHLDHPENWTTGNDPATDKQIGFIKVLEKQKGVSSGAIVEELGKSEASEIIGELKNA